MKLNEHHKIQLLKCSTNDNFSCIIFHFSYSVSFFYLNYLKQQKWWFLINLIYSSTRCTTSCLVRYVIKVISICFLFPFSIPLEYNIMCTCNQFCCSLNFMNCRRHQRRYGAFRKGFVTIFNCIFFFWLQSGHVNYVPFSENARFVVRVLCKTTWE